MTKHCNRTVFRGSLLGSSKSSSCIAFFIAHNLLTTDTYRSKTVVKVTQYHTHQGCFYTSILQTQTHTDTHRHRHRHRRPLTVKITYSCLIRNRSCNQICDGISHQKNLFTPIFIPPVYQKVIIPTVDLTTHHFSQASEI